jgi:hypothetical protein
MQEHFHSTKSLYQVQKLFGRILQEVERVYKMVVPWYIRKRRNLHLQKQHDTVIIAVHLLGKMLGFTSERMWHAFVQANLFSTQPFPERSRYHRRCRQLLQIIKRIRNFLLRRFTRQTCYTVIDSLPIPLCKSVRISRVRRLREIADTGYCASKKEHYYGLKCSFQITNEGFVVGYVVSKASVHDIRLVEELVEQFPHPYVLADKGYVSEPLREHLKRRFGIHFLAQPRSNRKLPFPKSLADWIRFKRKQIETLFSGFIDTFHLTNIRSTSPLGFELALEGILLAHTFLVYWAISSNGDGHRWKEQILI